MHIDFQLFKEWSHLNSELQKNSFSHIHAESLLTYSTTVHALQEITFELSNQFAMKKDVFFIKDVHPTLDIPITQLAKKGYRLKPLSWEQAQDKGYWEENLGRESLAFFCPIDDPVLGWVHPIEEIREVLQEKKILQIYLSHSWHKHRTEINLGKI